VQTRDQVAMPVLQTVAGARRFTLLVRSSVGAAARLRIVVPLLYRRKGAREWPRNSRECRMDVRDRVHKRSNRIPSPRKQSFVLIRERSERPIREAIRKPHADIDQQMQVGQRGEPLPQEVNVVCIARLQPPRQRATRSDHNLCFREGGGLRK
jgi:hypothetical protein